jgi:hypothetical protein
VQTVQQLTLILVDSFNLHLQKAYYSLTPFSISTHCQRSIKKF